MILISFTHLGLFRLPLEMMVILGVIILLILVAIGVSFFIKSNITMDSYNILLQTDDYTPKKKNGRRIMNKYAAIYWLTATMLYLGYSFLTNNWEHSWIIWPIAGILYGIIEKVLSLKNNDIASE
ncbi:hypothetical protein AO203_01710 [Lactobacillus gallinarum]|nr:hypothetical protein AO203_01710 [Lactobacillus gallinarum]